MPLIRTAKDIGEMFRQARLARGLSQAGVARQADVSRQWLVGLESGKPGAELGLVLRTAAVLGLTVHLQPSPSDVDEVLERARTP